MSKITSQTTSKIDAKLTVEIIDISGSTGRTETIDFSEEQSHESATVTTRESVFAERIPANTALILAIAQKYSNAYTEFDGYLDVDADVYVNGAFIAEFSEFFNLDTLHLKGEIWNTNYSSLSKSYIEIPLPENYLECNAVDLSEFGFDVEFL